MILSLDGLTLANRLTGEAGVGLCGNRWLARDDRAPLGRNGMLAKRSESLSSSAGGSNGFWESDTDQTAGAVRNGFSLE